MFGAGSSDCRRAIMTVSLSLRPGTDQEPAVAGERPGRVIGRKLAIGALKQLKKLTGAIDIAEAGAEQTVAARGRRIGWHIIGRRFRNEVIVVRLDQRLGDMLREAVPGGRDPVLRDEAEISD